MKNIILNQKCKRLQAVMGLMSPMYKYHFDPTNPKFSEQRIKLIDACAFFKKDNRIFNAGYSRTNYNQNKNL